MNPFSGSSLNVSINTKYVQQPQNIPVRISVNKSLVKQRYSNTADVDMKTQSDTPSGSLNTEEVEETAKHGRLALLLHERWLKRILNYGKSWEIRGKDTHVRGKIYLAFKNHIYGHTHIIDSFPITKAELQSSIHRHHVDDLSIVEYKTPYIWMLKDSEKYQKPIKFKRKPGQVVWCKVDMDALQKKKKKSKSRKRTKKTESNANDNDNAMDIDLPPMLSAPSEIIEHTIDLSKKLSAKKWKNLIPSDEYLCCEKKVGGPAVLCDKCEGFWHIYCLKYSYHINGAEMKRIQRDGQSFVCLDCYRKKIEKRKRKISKKQ